jgi:hypothetical protein
VLAYAIVRTRGCIPFFFHHPSLHRHTRFGHVYPFSYTTQLHVMIFFSCSGLTMLMRYDTAAWSVSLFIQRSSAISLKRSVNTLSTGEHHADRTRKGIDLDPMPLLYMCQTVGNIMLSWRLPWNDALSEWDQSQHSIDSTLAQVDQASTLKSHPFTLW